MRYLRAAMPVSMGLAFVLAAPSSSAQMGLPEAPKAAPLESAPSQKARLQNTRGQNAQSRSAGPGSLATPGPSLKITLPDAIRRAQALNPTYNLALTNAKVADEARKQARDANLPTVNYNSQYLYTQGNGTSSGRFIANNGVHEYIAEGDAREFVSASQIAMYRQSIAAAALARDQAGIARRGLVVTVVASYALLVAAENKLKNLQQAQSAAQTFLTTTKDLERGGEVAHADVIKAQIQLSDSKIAVENAEAIEQQARTALALLLFPNLDQQFELTDNPGGTLPLPSFQTAESEAHSRNPALKAAKAAKREAVAGVTAAWTQHLPTLTLDYFYGIDANHFATWSPDPAGRIKNLGYSAWAQLNLPIWNWGATHSKVKQAKALNQQAALDLSFAGRKIEANLRQFYREAQAAQEEVNIRKTAAADAEQSRRLTLVQYKAGQATALQVVNAEQTVSLERNAFADAETRYATAIADLSTLTGSF